MIDRERALETIEATHPIVIGNPNDTSGEVHVFIPTGISSMELEDKEVLTIVGGSDMSYTDYDEFVSILVDDAGYIQLAPTGNDFLNTFVDLSNDY